MTHVIISYTKLSHSFNIIPLLLYKCVLYMIFHFLYNNITVILKINHNKKKDKMLQGQIAVYPSRQNTWRGKNRTMSPKHQKLINASRKRTTYSELSGATGIKLWTWAPAKFEINDSSATKPHIIIHPGPLDIAWRSCSCPAYPTRNPPHFHKISWLVHKFTFFNEQHVPLKILAQPVVFAGHVLFPTTSISDWY